MSSNGASPAATPSASAPPVATPSPSASPGATPKPTSSPSPSAAPSVSTKALWALNSTTVAEFASSQIAGGTVTPIHQFTIADANFPVYAAMAFDASGDLWIGEGNTVINAAGNYSGQIAEFTAAQLAALATVPNPAPFAKLSVAGAVEGLAFDATGTLWASVFAFHADQFQAFGPATLAAGSGAPVPAITTTVQAIGAIAFGSDGSLYLSPISVFGPSAGIVYGYAPSQLTTSSQSAAWFLEASGPSLVDSGQEAIVVPSNQLRFDAAGNLWSIFNGYTFAFAAGTLHSSSATTLHAFQGYPAQGAGGSTTVYNGYPLAFDTAFDLIENNSADTLHEYTAAQYASGGSAFAAATLNAMTGPAGNGNVGNFIIAGPYVP